MRPACLLAALALSGCDEDTLPGADDLAVARDLARVVDAAAAVDAPAADMAAPVPDMTSVPDLAAGDLLGCGGGYLNTDAGDACPLGCSMDVRAQPDEGRIHVNYCDSVPYQNDPPSSGPHWPSPAPWGFHQEVVPREWWVHNLEHGGVVLLFNCPNGDGGQPYQLMCNDGGFPDVVPADQGCPGDIIQLQQIMAAQPQDNWYDLLFETRILITADPKLKTRFAAVAWDWVWAADQLDVAAVKCFIAARYGRGPEDAP